MVKRVVKIIGVGLASFIGLVLLYLGAAYVLSRIAVNENHQASNEVKIYILSNGVHTDIVLPIRSQTIDWSQHVSFENTLGKDTLENFVAFGWGDKGFYLETPTWGDLTFSVAFKAAFALGNSAIHTTFYKQMRESNSCRGITLSLSEYEQLVAYITDSFRKSESGALMYIQTNAVYGTTDAFYEAVGSYHLFHTCNTWANNALKACNQKACLWTPFDTGIFYHYTNQ
jgi:uncharacterized protein (TIGR02117 family)